MVSARHKRESAVNGKKQPKVWKTRPQTEENINLNDSGLDRSKYTKDDSTGLWVIYESNPFMVPSVTEDDLTKGPAILYIKQKKTNLGYERKSGPSSTTGMTM